MSFKPGDISLFSRYQFTDTGESAKHFGLVLLPEEATKYKNSLLCCVITSRNPKHWAFLLDCKKYRCFNCNSFACFNRKDLVAKTGLAKGLQPKDKLDRDDFKKAFKILKTSLFVIKDIASDPFLRGTIIFEWKQSLKNI